MDLGPVSDSVRREICQLASNLLDKQIDEAGRQRLESLMESHVGARACFVDCMALHVLLEATHEPALCHTQELRENVVPLGHRGELPENYNSNRTAGSHQRIFHRSLGKLTTWVLAGCLLFASGFWLSFRGAEKPPSSFGFVGVLSKVSEVEWGSNWQPSMVPARLAAGQRICMDAGLAELTLNSGCTIVIRGPAEVELVSAMRVLALKGTVRARVGDDAKGFVIETPSTNVVDLGTEVGVQVDDVSNSTNVVVFEGAVDLHAGTSNTRRKFWSLGSPAFKSTRLNFGEALRVKKSGVTSRIVSIRSDQFPTAVNSHFGQKRPPLIRSITDNIREPDAMAYYEIVHNGLWEDSRAYVDRYHEWNGIDERGIPPFLRSADYVRCFNSDKFRDDLEITLETAAPVRLFVFFDDRLPVPKWLSDAFVLTKHKIGIDEGFPSHSIWKDGTTPPVIGVGAGKSIDHTYSIWEKDLPLPTKVRLGSLSNRHVEVSMYGIAVVPLGTFLGEGQTVPPLEHGQ